MRILPDHIKFLSQYTSDKNKLPTEWRHIKNALYILLTDNNLSDKTKKIIKVYGAQYFKDKAQLDTELQSKDLQKFLNKGLPEYIEYMKKNETITTLSGLRNEWQEGNDFPYVGHILGIIARDIADHNFLSKYTSNLKQKDEIKNSLYILLKEDLMSKV